VWYSAKQGTTSHLAHLYTVPFLWPQEQRRQSSWVYFTGQCLLWLLLLRLAAAVVPLSHLIPSQCQQPEFLWWLPPQSFIYFFPAITRDLQSSALFKLLYMTWHSFRNIIPVRYEHLLQWQQNRSKATMWLLYKNSSYLRVPKMLLLDWRLYVACYYPTTPTDYPSTKRGMSMGPPIAVNIEFCGYLRFLSISFVWIIWVQYATDHLSGQQIEFAS